MRFVQTVLPVRLPELLGLVHGGRRYLLNVLHGALEEVRTPAPLRRTHAHAVYHVVLYLRGQGHVLLGDERMSVSPGSLVLVGPGEEHDFGPVGPAPLTYAELTFELVGSEGDLLELPFAELLRRYAGQSSEQLELELPVTLSATRARALHEYMRRALTPLSEGRDALEAYAAIAVLFADLVRELEIVGAARGGPARDLDEPNAIRRARLEIERRYREPLRVPELAERAHLSTGYFIRAFKRATGLPPLAYQQMLRIEAARNLLCCTSFGCKEIAEEVGFSDVCFFTRAFRRAVGETPAAFRRGGKR
jgi:AraC-like DNA-binding protein/mannose-6-phosphate isomerase-like protein (cupin superfamily)